MRFLGVRRPYRGCVALTGGCVALTFTRVWSTRKLRLCEFPSKTCPPLNIHGSDSQMEEITCIRAAVLFEAAFRFGVEIGFALAMAANSDTASVASLDTSCCDLDDGSATDQEDNGSITTPMVYKFRKGMVLRCLILLRGQCLCGYVICLLLKEQEQVTEQYIAKLNLMRVKCCKCCKHSSSAVASFAISVFWSLHFGIDEQGHNASTCILFCMFCVLRGLNCFEGRSYRFAFSLIACW